MTNRMGAVEPAVSGRRTYGCGHAPGVRAEALDAMSIIDCVLPGGQSGVAGIRKPIAGQLVPQVAKINKGVCPLVGKGGPRTAKNESLKV